MRYILPFALVATLAAPLSAQPTDAARFQKETEDLVKKLFVAVDPGRPENAYMPPALREKLSWIAKEMGANRLEILIAHDFHSSSTGVLMGASVENGKKTIWVFGPLLRIEARLEERRRTGSNDFLKDKFALGLAHEATHFETPSRPGSTFESRRKEEDRVWRKVIIGMARPMRALGRRIDHDHLTGDDFLRRCGDRPDCPEFTEFIRKRTSSKPLLK